MIPQEIGHVVKFKNNVMGLFKKGWWEIPEVMGSSFMAILGVALATIGAYNYHRDNGDNREFKLVYYILREGDPKVKLLRNPVFTEYPDPDEEKKKKSHMTIITGK